MEIYRLYPEYQKQDRRKQNLPVSLDRRVAFQKRLERITTLDPKLSRDITQIKDVFAPFITERQDIQEPAKEDIKKDTAICFLSAIPFLRRFFGIKDAISNHEYFKGIGKGLIQYLNVKEDWRDIAKIFKPGHVPNDYQVPFSFTRGTPLETIDFIKKFRKFDKTLFETKPCQIVLDKLGVKGIDFYLTKKFTKIGEPVVAFKVIGNPIVKVLSRTFLRIPMLSLILLSALEIPSIINDKKPLKQTLKSAINVSSIVFGGALLGAIGAYAGPIGSLAGLGIGTYLAGKLANRINSKIT